MTKTANILWYRKVYSIYHCGIIHFSLKRDSLRSFRIVPVLREAEDKAEDENCIRLRPSAIFLICIAVLLAAGCARETKEDLEFSGPQELSASEKEIAESPDEMFSSFSLTGYAKGGKKQWDLAGKSADIMTEKIELLDVNSKIYGKDMDMTIVADEGTLNRLNNSIHLEKNVLVSTEDGATLKTDSLDWDAETEKLAGDAPVWIEKGIMQAQGIGIIGRPTLSLIRLKKDVTMKIFLEERAGVISDEAVPVVITCDGPLEVDYQNNLAVFQDNVKVKDSRGEIFADKMDVYLAAQDEGAKTTEGLEGMGLEKVIAVGNVEIHHQGNISYSQKAVYDTTTGALTLTGQPKLVIYSTEGFGQIMGSADTETE